MNRSDADRALADLLAQVEGSETSAPLSSDASRSSSRRWSRGASWALAGLRIVAILLVLAAAAGLVVVVAFHPLYHEPPAVDAAAAEAADVSLRIPVAGVQSLAVVSPWGASRDGGARTHKGIDIFAPVGTPVVAPRPGVVTGRYTGQTAGKHVWLIDDNDRYGYLFLHLSAFADGVGRGTRVAAGDTLGFVGKTGNATYTPGHLHFGVARLNRPGTLAAGKVKLNPRPFLHANDTPGIRRTLEALRTQLALRTHAMGWEVWLPIG